MVVEIGPGVTGFEKGQAVYGIVAAPTPSMRLVPAGGLAPIPRNLSFDQAAAVPMGAVTAWRPLFDMATCSPASAYSSRGPPVAWDRWPCNWPTGKGPTWSAPLRRDLRLRPLARGRRGDRLPGDPVRDGCPRHGRGAGRRGGRYPGRSLKVLRPGGIFVTIAGMPPQEQAQKRGVRVAGVGRAEPARAGELLREMTR